MSIELCAPLKRRSQPSTIEALDLRFMPCGIDSTIDATHVVVEQLPLPEPLEGRRKADAADTAVSAARRL